MNRNVLVAALIFGGFAAVTYVCYRLGNPMNIDWGVSTETVPLR